MTIRHMYIFVQVYQAKSITKAAELLHMTQPAVSRSIKELEQYYGICLFERINHRLSPTECGKQLYIKALHLTDVFDSIEKELRNWDTLGILRVGSSITIANSLLIDVINAFQKNHPNIRIEVTVLNGSSLQKKLLDNHLDIALIEGGSNQPELHSEVFAEDYLVPVLPLNHALSSKENVSLRDLAALNFLAREKGSSIRTYVDSMFSRKNILLNPLWESSSTQAIVKAVHAGIGISILPEKLVENDILNGVISTCKMAHESLECAHYIVWHKNKYMTSNTLDFISLCKSYPVF